MIAIDVVSEASGEILFKKIAGRFLIEILVKSDAGSTKTVMSFFDTQAQEKITALSDTLSVEKAAYKVLVTCEDEII